MNSLNHITSFEDFANSLFFNVIVLFLMTHLDRRYPYFFISSEKKKSVAGEVCYVLVPPPLERYNEMKIKIHILPCRVGARAPYKSVVESILIMWVAA